MTEKSTNKNIVEGLKKAIEVCKNTIDQKQVEHFCDHIGVTQSYFKSETINKIVTALEKEINTIELENFIKLENL